MLELFGLDVKTEEGREKVRRVGRAALITGAILLVLGFIFLSVFAMVSNASSALVDVANTFVMISLPFLFAAAYMNRVLREASGGK
ncbi:hypothetical protein [Geoglobus ahangari]